MTTNLNDREEAVVIAALQMFKDKLTHYLSTPKPRAPYSHLASEHELLSPEHSLAHVITALSKFSGKPVATFMSTHPSQTHRDNMPVNPLTGKCGICNVAIDPTLGDLCDNCQGDLHGIE